MLPLVFPICRMLSFIRQMLLKTLISVGDAHREQMSIVIVFSREETSDLVLIWINFSLALVTKNCARNLITLLICEMASVYRSSDILL